MEWVVVVVCLGAAGLTVAVEPGGRRVRRAAAAAVAIAVLVAGAALLYDIFAPTNPLLGTDGYRPGDARRLDERQEYAGAASCRACHPGEYASWDASFHRRMTAKASLENIVPDIVDERFEWQGRWYRLWREGDTIVANTPRFGTTGAAAEDRVVAPVVMTTGSHHMQAYWTPVPDTVTVAEERGRSLFNAKCARCHGREGRGGSGPKLLGAGFLAHEIAPWIRNGLRGHTPSLQDRMGIPGGLIEIVPFSDDDAGPGDADAIDADKAPASDPAQNQAPTASNDLDEAFQEDEVAAVEAFLMRIQFDGKLAQFPYVYLVEKKRWVHEEDSFLQPPVVVETQERAGDRWGYNCDECHSTGASYGYLPAPLVARSDAVDLGIACESCHGPAKAHVESQRDPVERYRRHFGEMPPPSSGANVPKTAPDIIHPQRLPHDRASYVCAQCHADIERKGVGYLGFKPGDDLEKVANFTYVPKEGEDVPAWLEAGLEDDSELLSGGFWDDGTMRIAGRDFNGLKESACFKEGTLSCLSCHSMHHGRPDDQLHPAMDPAATSSPAASPVPSPSAASDRACLGCHAKYEALPAMTAHTHHAADSEGSRCVNCHMPYTTYGLLKAIRAHRVDSPTVEMTTTFGRPNACNLCHLDKTLAFTDDHLQQWYGRPAAVLDDVERTVAAGPLWMLEGDAVVRAIAAWHMGWDPARATSARDDGGAWLDHYLAFALDDEYIAVRLIAEHRLTDDVKGAFAALNIPYPADADARKAAQATARHMAGLPHASAVDTSLLLTPQGLDDAAVAARLRDRDRRDVRVNE